MNRKDRYLIAVSSFVLLGSERIKLLYKFFKSYKKIWESSYSELTLLGLSGKIASEFVKYKKYFDIDNYLKKLKENEIKVYTHKDKDYPENLKEIQDKPLVLYVKGNIKNNDVASVAIVGSRKMSEYGKSSCIYFASNLARKKITVVSGLARGIDSQAHISALKNKGRTIAVLGSGIDRIYPYENKRLSEEVIKNGALVSEYPLGYPPFPNNFIERNRIITGLSKVCLVIEGAERSGTLTTSSFAANQGRSVFAVPGRISDANSFVTNMLIENGAEVAVFWEDVLKSVKI